ncbi:MAG: 4Fe-4S dicluster domain-containing protein [Thermodesulfobacteriota bacterium]
MAEKREKRSKRAFHLVVKRERCKGCYLCMHVCPKDVFDKEEGFNAKGYQPVRAARPQDCTGCRACTIVCPDVVFELYELAETA